MAYDLKQETLDKLGMNKDMTEKADATPTKGEEVDEHGNEIRSYSDAEVGINLGMEFLTSKETTEKETKPKSEEPPKEQPTKESAKEETTGKETPKEQPDSQTEPTFESSVIERLKSFDDEEKRSKFLKDLDNYEKFTASNTQERQKIADERKQLQQIIDELGAKEIQDSIDEILKLDDLKDFLDSADDWYSDRENGNPIRKFIETLRSKSGNVKQAHESQSVFDKERSDLELEKEVFEIQKLDERYKDTETLVQLGDLADQHGVSLKTAHKIWLADNLQTSVSDLNDKIKALEKDKSSLKKELKSRNEELTELKSKAMPSPGVVGSVGAESFEYTTPSTGFDETEARLHKKLGLA